MKRMGPWLAVLCLVWLIAAWVAPVVAAVSPGYEPQVKLLHPEEFEEQRANGSGKFAVMDGGTNAGATKSGGIWSWLADHAMGFVKGIGAGLIGAAVVVGAAALVLGAGAPLLLMAASAVVGGALYGAMTGSANFNWTEAIVGSVIGGVSAGVGNWIAGTGTTLARRIGVAAVNMVGGGAAGVASYLIHEQNPTLGGAMTAFGIGAGASAVFMGAGAAVSKGWKWVKGVLGFGGQSGKNAYQKALLQNALADEPVSLMPKGTGGSGETISEETITIIVKGDTNKNRDLINFAREIIPLEGYHDVLIHGSPNDVELGIQRFSHRWLAKYLQQAGYQGGAIRLISCSTGQLENGFAQNLANKLGVEVLAPTDMVWVHPNGQMTIGPKYFLNTGSWKVFRPWSR